MPSNHGVPESTVLRSFSAAVTTATATAATATTTAAIAIAIATAIAIAIAIAIAWQFALPQHDLCVLRKATTPMMRAAKAAARPSIYGKAPAQVEVRATH